jgi:hypothetical protein
LRSDEDPLDSIVSGSYAPLRAPVLIQDNGPMDKIRMPHTDWKQIRRHVEHDAVAYATDPATGPCEIGRQRLTVIVG